MLKSTQTGDSSHADPSGTDVGLLARQANSFNFTVFGQKARSVHVSKLKRVHQKDGYTYAM